MLRPQGGDTTSQGERFADISDHCQGRAEKGFISLVLLRLSVFLFLAKKNVMGTITKMVHHTKCSFKFKVEKIFPYAAIFCKTIQVSLFTHINPQTPRHIHFTIERQKSY